MKESLQDRSKARGKWADIRLWLSGATLTAGFLLFSLISGLGQRQPIEEDQGITGFGLALRRLPTVARLLYVTAHPDDEDNALLAKLSRGQGIRTALLTLTRGDGGQNEIGPELFEALGVLRTEELMAVHRFDAVEQFFTRAYEFGYSFSVGETLSKWGKEEILQDIVRVIRIFRPQIMLSLSPDGEGGGQHHQASAQLAAWAFRLAGDSQVFSQQLQVGLRPWQPEHLYQLAVSDDEEAIRIELSQYDPLLGESYVEFGARARSNHRCQGMNLLAEPGLRVTRYRLADSLGISRATDGDFFTGLDTSLPSLASYEPELAAGLNELQRHVDRARAFYEQSNYTSAAGSVMAGLAQVRRLVESALDQEARFFLRQKEKDFLTAARRGHFFYFDALTGKTRDGLVTRGEEFEVELRFLNRSSMPTHTLSLGLQAPSGWEVRRDSQNGLDHFKVKVGSQAEYSQPYWYRDNPKVDRFAVKLGFSGVEAQPLPVLMARVDYLSSGVEGWVERPVEFRWFDTGMGRERRNEIQVVPKLSLNLEPKVGVVGLGGPRTKLFRVSVTNNLSRATTATVRLEVPPGWQTFPARKRLDFRYENEEITTQFRVDLPAQQRSATYTLGAVAEMCGHQYSQGHQIIDYPHIQRRHIYRPARARLRVFPVEIPLPLKVGYVMGVGDQVGSATRELGAEIVYLEEADLASSDLSRFDVIVTGIRAYLTRKDLIAYNQRLLDYVRNGGHLVVQYNKYEFNQNQYGPYPARINRPHDRVTVEDSQVKVLVPDHPVFTWPNRIGKEDWSGWVQERGLYFLGEWDNRYQPLLEFQDPWPYNRGPKLGGLLIAAYGRGTYIYTGVSFFRQLKEGIPGPLRLWANILALGRHPAYSGSTMKPG